MTDVNDLEQVFHTVTYVCVTVGGTTANRTVFFNVCVRLVLQFLVLIV